jgi:hypothetical protein
MDILDLRWRTTGVNVQCPQILLSARLVDSQTQKTVYADLRESVSKHVLFPNIVARLTGDERKQLIEDIAMSLIRIYQARHQE